MPTPRLPQKRKLSRVPESSVEKEIRTLAELNGWRTHKIDVMRGVTVEYKKKDGRTSKRKFSEGEVGQADLIMVRPWAIYSYDCIYVECKTANGRYSKNQLAWAEVRRREGYVVIQIDPKAPNAWMNLCEQAALIGIKVERKTFA